MSKIITSNVEGFKGTVTLKSRLFLEDVFAIEGALDESANMESSAFWDKINKATDKRDENGEIMKITWSSKTDAAFLKAVLHCAESFSIEGLEEKPTIENFPFSPRKYSGEFIKLLWDELQKIYSGEISVPNES